MYGLVNKAIRDLIVSEFGEPKWIEIADAAGADHRFISMQGYDDQLTYDLVEHASELLQVEPANLLRQFGSYWIRYTASEGYGHIFSIFGETLEEFLGNLGNDLHGRVALTMPDLQPPEFETQVLGDQRYEVTYRSHRLGLQPMVHGLLEGLGVRFERSVNVTHTESRECNGIVEEVFEVKITD